MAAEEGKRLILLSLPVPRPKLRIAAYIARTGADCIDDSAQQLQGMGRDSSWVLESTVHPAAVVVAVGGIDKDCTADTGGMDRLAKAVAVDSQISADCTMRQKATAAGLAHALALGTDTAPVMVVEGAAVEKNKTVPAAGSVVVDEIAVPQEVAEEEAHRDLPCRHHRAAQNHPRYPRYH